MASCLARQKRLASNLTRRLHHLATVLSSEIPGLQSTRTTDRSCFCYCGLSHQDRRYVARHSYDCDYLLGIELLSTDDTTNTKYFNCAQRWLFPTNILTICILNEALSTLIVFSLAYRQLVYHFRLLQYQLCGAAIVSYVLAYQSQFSHTNVKELYIYFSQFHEHD